MLLTWRQRSNQRRALATLDQRMREDIGLSNEQIFDEAKKPFWIE
ncbi:MAG: DUF1127 domain-containing protein [Gammaproteobacteria bacterium]|nr:DUF1127 domain-containing protein [Gammaproteobacteria bacterium]